MGPITTSGGAITLDAENGITISKPVISNGGNQMINADADGNGTGTLSLDFALAQLTDPNPASGNQFGLHTAILPSGNVVVTSPFDDFGAPDAGAVYLFNGFTGALISALRGSTVFDNVGSGGLTLLNNGNYLVTSLNWDSGTVSNVGAVTWGSGLTGVSGTVSSSNSLVGSASGDQVGSQPTLVLTNGNYVVRSPFWDNGTATNAGAATWGNGSTGVSGVVSAANSLVGSTISDSIATNGQALANGNYFLQSSSWDNGTVANVGAVTWGNGSTGVSGVVSASNSLIGSTASDQLGSTGTITALTNGNFVVPVRYGTMEPYRMSVPLLGSTERPALPAPFRRRIA